MKKLNKRINNIENTIQAYGCSCTSALEKCNKDYQESGGSENAQQMLKDTNVRSQTNYNRSNLFCIYY